MSARPSIPLPGANKATTFTTSADRRASEREDGLSKGAALYLPVFLALLVLFIVLTARDAPKADRTAAVLASIETKFPPFQIDRRLAWGDRDLGSRTGTVFSMERLTSLGDLFASELSLAKVTAVTPGRMIEIAFPVDSLFTPNTVWIRPEKTGVMDRVVDGLRFERDGERFILEALLSIGEAATNQGPGPIQRASALAEALVRLGAPAQSVTVGVERGEPGAARFVFSARDARETTSGLGGGR